MKFFTVTELRNKISEIINKVELTNEQIAITKRGKPIIIIRPVTEDDFAFVEGEKKKDE